jgi:beta-N-acetylhexosaminidase
MAGKDSLRRLPSPPRIRLRRPLVGPLALTWIIGVAGISVALATGAGDGASFQDRKLPPEASGRGSERRGQTSFLAQLVPPAPEELRGPRVPRSLADLARRLPLDRAVAQLFLFGFEGQDATAPIYQEVRRLDLGGVVIQGRNYRDPQQLAALTGEFGAVARAEGHIPPWVMTEQDGGESSQLPDLPPGSAPGEFRSPANAAAAMAEATVALRALGITGLFDPPLDVQPGEAEGVLGTQALKGQPEDVARYGVAVIRACRTARMLCAAKHFPGIGAASNPTDEGPAQIGLSMEQLTGRDLVPFAAAVRAGIGAIVVGHGLYDADDFVTPASISPNIIRGLLRKRLGFEGVAITDDLADPGVSTFAPVPDAALEAIRAGADLVYISGPLGEQVAAYTAVLDAARRGEISKKRIREALLRVLQAKREVGLLGDATGTTGPTGATGATTPPAP